MNGGEEEVEEALIIILVTQMGGVQQQWHKLDKSLFQHVFFLPYQTIDAEGILTSVFINETSPNKNDCHDMNQRTAFKGNDCFSLHFSAKKKSGRVRAQQ